MTNSVARSLIKINYYGARAGNVNNPIYNMSVKMPRIYYFALPPENYKSANRKKLQKTTKVPTGKNNARNLSILL